MARKRRHEGTREHGSWHHRKPTSIGGSKRDTRNLSYVKPKMHEAWHALFGNASAQEIAKMISDVWLDSDYYFIASPRKRNRVPKEYVVCQWCGAKSPKPIKEF